MSERDFRLVFPGNPANQYFFKEPGWEKEGIYDYSCETNEGLQVTFGSTPPWAKYATKSDYVNENSDLKLIIVDYFDQGPIYARWRRASVQTDDLKQSGFAIYINGKWLVKNLEESFYFNWERKIVDDQKIIYKIILKFNRKIGFISSSAVKIEIIREED